MKRILTFLVCCFSLFSLLSSTAFADDIDLRKYSDEDLLRLYEKVSLEISDRGLNKILEQLELSREATDLANIRSALAALTVGALVDEDEIELQKNNSSRITFRIVGDGKGKKYEAIIALLQTENGWQSGEQVISTLTIPADSAIGSGKAILSFDKSTEKCSICFE